MELIMSDDQGLFHDVLNLHHHNKLLFASRNNLFAMGCSTSIPVASTMDNKKSEHLGNKTVDVSLPESAPDIVSSQAPKGGCSGIGTKMDSMETGTKMYMSLYPERSTDGIVHLGNIVPDFSADTTHGHIDSFHKWKAGKWAILFSHPADFTPVCTTEIASLAAKYDEIVSMNCAVATLSVDPVKSHEEWLRDVVAHSDVPIEIRFPIIADTDRGISTAYGMIDPWSSDKQTLPLTIRAVFIINPENKLMLTVNYPACVGRNMSEILRCLKALQLSYGKSIATPANWPLNHANLRLPDGTYTSEYKGSVFLLPTVSDEDAQKYHPGFLTCDVPSKVPYLRLVKLEDLTKGGNHEEESKIDC